MRCVVCLELQSQCTVDAGAAIHGCLYVKHCQITSAQEKGGGHLNVKSVKQSKYAAVHAQEFILDF